MQTTRLHRVIAAAMGRRRRFALDAARAERVREQLLGLRTAAREERHLTCYLDRSDGSLVAAALSRPWACLELSCAATLDCEAPAWELVACRTRGPTITRARLQVEAALLPAIARGDAPLPRGDGSRGARRKLAAWRTYLALRGNGPLVPSLLVLASRLEVHTGDAVLVLDGRRSVHVAPLDLLDDAAAGREVAPAARGRELPGAVLEAQLAGGLPPDLARLLEGTESSNGSAFASACGAVFPADLPASRH